MIPGRTLLVRHGAYPTIGDALGNAPDGGIIAVAAGTYAETFELTDRQLTLRAHEGGEVVVDGTGGDWPVLKVRGGSLTLHGLTLKGAAAAVRAEDMFLSDLIGGPGTFSGVRVLVVEDDENLRVAIAGALRAAGFAVLEARVRRLCRRMASGLPPVPRCGDLDVDSGRHEVRRAGVLLTLTGKIRISHRGDVNPASLETAHRNPPGGNPNASRSACLHRARRPAGRGRVQHGRRR